jgi:hypothetical protein
MYIKESEAFNSNFYFKTSAMSKKLFSLVIGLMTLSALQAQKTKTVDSLAYYDDLFNELDAFIDSITAPRNMVLVNIGVGGNFLNYQSGSDIGLDSRRKIVIAPSVGYYHKNGLGITGASTIVHDGTRMNPYQFLISGSYDYLGNQEFITGVSATHFFTKDLLPFYTSPLKNEVNGYFTYKGWWVKPSVSVSYGWGSRSDYEEREEYITSLRLRPAGYTQINTRESINDFSIMTSARHDFYWLDLLGKDYVLRLTPQLMFVSGTQKFGFNQTSSTYTAAKMNGKRVLFDSDNVYLDDSVAFQPLSLTAFLKSELSFGKFFVQPQLALDYYFPAKERNLSAGFGFNAGLIF